AAAIQVPRRPAAVTWVDLGCRSAAEVTANAAAARFPVPDELWQRLAEAGFVPEQLLDGHLG
ncbi:aldo/keto reductase, partial [Streptomyces sp. NPDC059802]